MDFVVLQIRTGPRILKGRYGYSWHNKEIKIKLPLAAVRLRSQEDEKLIIFSLSGLIEGWPYLRGFILSNILNSDAIRTKVSGHYREGGHSSGVVIKRGSTVYL